MESAWHELAEVLDADGVHVGKVRRNAGRRLSCKGGPPTPCPKRSTRQLRPAAHVQIDGTRERGLLSRFSVQHFPSIYHVVGKETREYEGPRSVEAVGGCLCWGRRLLRIAWRLAFLPRLCLLTWFAAEKLPWPWADGPFACCCAPINAAAADGRLCAWGLA